MHHFVFYRYILCVYFSFRISHQIKHKMSSKYPVEFQCTLRSLSELHFLPVSWVIQRITQLLPLKELCKLLMKMSLIPSVWTAVWCYLNICLMQIPFSYSFKYVSVHICIKPHLCRTKAAPHYRKPVYESSFLSTCAMIVKKLQITSVKSIVQFNSPVHSVERGIAFNIFFGD